jgi:hypothetical protein
MWVSPVSLLELFTEDQTGLSIAADIRNLNTRRAYSLDEVERIRVASTKARDVAKSICQEKSVRKVG